MSKEQIDSVLSTEKKESETGVNESFGLWGTIERIRCFCDKEDIVRINSELGEYTEIEFIMPNKRQG
jgi:two-component system sensor histidine kinase YesM